MTNDNNKQLRGLLGAHVSDREYSMAADPRGPLLMQNVYFLEQMAHFDREVTPKRRMHAKGSGAYGTLNKYA